MSYKFIHAPDHPLATSWGTVLEHRAVLYDAIGPGAHDCHWCGTAVIWRKGRGGATLTVDHLDNDPKNNDLANLVPACATCNNFRSRPDHLVSRDEPHIMRGHKRIRAEELTCPECGSQFLVPKAEATRRRFCSKPCMYTGRLKHR